ncbi:MAG: hypothetical protein NVS4B2_21450 [Chloroflexota bacterium]
MDRAVREERANARGIMVSLTVHKKAAPPKRSRRECNAWSIYQRVEERRSGW